MMDFLNDLTISEIVVGVAALWVFLCLIGWQFKRRA
jgi:hypothetical protein